MKAIDELKVGKNSIGYVSSRLVETYKDQELVERPVPPFKTLERRMTDAEIESEFTSELSTLSDIVAFLKNPPEGSKDGNWNLFYTEAFVVRVRWGVSGWCVGAWFRDGDGWRAGRRVFAPATGSSKPEISSSSDTLTLEQRVERIEKWIENF